MLACRADGNALPAIMGTCSKAVPIAMTLQYLEIETHIPGCTAQISFDMYLEMGPHRQ